MHSQVARRLVAAGTLLLALAAVLIALLLLVAGTQVESIYDAAGLQRSWVLVAVLGSVALGGGIVWALMTRASRLASDADGVKGQVT